MHDDKTTKSNFPLPHVGNQLKIDVERIRTSLEGIDVGKQDLLAANIRGALEANTALSASNYAVGLDQSGIATLGDSTTIFAADDPGARNMGVKTVSFGASRVSAKDGKTPMWQLFGSGSEQRYLVVTNKQETGWLYQMAVDVMSGNLFSRTYGVNITGGAAWNAWKLLGMNAFTSPTYWISPDGDDATGDGTYENPFGTFAHAFARVPTYIATTYTISLKNGVYDTAMYLSRRTGPGDFILSGESQGGVTIKANSAYQIHLVRMDCRVTIKNFVLDGAEYADNGGTGLEAYASQGLTTVTYTDVQNLLAGFSAIDAEMKLGAVACGENVARMCYSWQNATIYAVNLLSGNPTYKYYANGGRIVEHTPNAATGLELARNGGTIDKGTQLEKPSAETLIPINGAALLPAGGTWLLWRLDPSTSQSRVDFYPGGSQLLGTDFTGFAWQVAK